MLIKLKLNSDKITMWNDNIDRCIKEYGDESGIFNGWRIKEGQPFLKGINNYPIGFYNLPFSCSPLPIGDITDYKVKHEFHSFMPKNMEEWGKLFSYKQICSGRNNYGVCDGYRQILKEYPELESEKESPFIVNLKLITKKGCPDWRWHKNGKYIGDYTPEYEHLGDESINSVISFHIYELFP